MMKNLLANDTVQIEILNACVNQCANCSRHVGHHSKPYFMSFDIFQKAVDSMVEFPFMTGITGGEPLIHPEFESFCKYISSKIEPDRLGLWTTFPKGYEHYREIICSTFGHIFLNDHTRADVYHHPGLVASREVVPYDDILFQYVNTCWAQAAWSPSINPKGAFFCEIAAALSILFEGSDGWPVTPKWWWRTPKDYTSQIEEFCPQCGFCVPLQRRSSVETVDDISPGNLERLKDKSPKIKNGNYIISDLKLIEKRYELPLAAYKDLKYRNKIADRYGIFLVLNNKNFLSPYLKKNFNKDSV